jgi:hypothetical protein
MVLIWLPLLVVCGSAGALWHFVSFAFLSNPILNGMILLVMLWGAVTMVGHVQRVYREDRVFFAGLDWLRKGVWSNEPDPRLGPDAYVMGMLTRLEKLGLGHAVYVQSATMEPELEALEHFYEQKQELSQFLVGLMVGLGLLGTFIGLLETLVATSELIGTIANSVGGAGGGIESEFARIVGGLQKPLSAMGTAFSASMFGLIGSIMLGFQMVIVRKTCAMMVEHAREEVLSLAEKTKVNANVQITERFLATLLGDILEQHRRTEERLESVANQLAVLTPKVEQAALSSTRLADRVGEQSEVLDRTASAVGQVRDVVPLMSGLASNSAEVMREVGQTQMDIGRIVSHLPDQQKLTLDLSTALAALADLARQVGESRAATNDLTTEVRLQGSVVKRLDAVLWNDEKSSIQKLLGGSSAHPTAEKP